MSGSPAHALRKHGFVQPVRGARHVPLAILAAFVVVPPLVATGQLAPLNDLLSLGHAGGQTPARVATVRRAEPPFEATPRANCLPGVAQGAGHPGAGARGRGRQRPALQRRPARPPGHLGRLQGLSLRRRARARVRVLRHGPAVPAQRAQAVGRLPGRRGARHVEPAQAGADGHADRDADELAARVAGAQRQARAARRRDRQPGDLSRGWCRSTTCSEDCRQPVLQSTRPVARLGHESGFAQDGKTFYATPRPCRRSRRST